VALRRIIPPRQGTLFVVGILVIVGFLVRLAGIGESLFGDELFAYEEIHEHSLAQVVGNVTQGEENSPPLYFVLAWGAMKLGDDTVFIRLPSLVLGSATVAVVYLLGERMVGRSAGLVAAGLTALSPLAVYFSDEARPYATLMFLLAASTLALMSALDTRRKAWWLVFWASSVAALYTHYTAAPVLAVQGTWALWAHRERARDVLVAHVAVAVGLLPWLPRLAEQRRGAQDLELTGAIFPLSLESFARASAQVVPGYQRMGLAEVPGRLAMWLFGSAVAAALLGALVQSLRRRAEGTQRSSAPLVLVVALALATPAGVLLYSLFGADIYTPRHLLASFPAIVVLLAALLTSLPRPLAAAATLVTLAALTIGLVRAFDPGRSRPPLKQAAHFIDARAAPEDPVVEFVFLGAKGLFTRHLAINFERRHPLYQTGLVRPRSDFWTALDTKSRIFVVEAWGDPPVRNPLPPEVAKHFELADTHVWRGTASVAVLEFTAKESDATGS